MSPDELDTAKVRDLLAMGADAEVLVLDVLEACDALRAERNRPAEAPEWYGHFVKAAAEIKELRAERDALRAERDGWKLRSDHKSELAADHWARALQAEAERDALRDRLAAVEKLCDDYSKRQEEQHRLDPVIPAWRVRAVLTAERPPAVGDD